MKSEGSLVKLERIFESEIPHRGCYRCYNSAKFVIKRSRRSADCPCLLLIFLLSQSGCFRLKEHVLWSQGPMIPLNNSIPAVEIGFRLFFFDNFQIDGFCFRPDKKNRSASNSDLEGRPEIVNSLVTASPILFIRLSDL